MSDLFAGLDAAAIRCGQTEQWAQSQGYGPLIGLDEAGRGPLAGPVVAAAVALPRPCPIEGLDDSKALSEARREALFDLIVAHADAYGIAAIGPAEIDEINILQASLKAMGEAWRQAVAGAPHLSDALVLVDGNQRAHLPGHVEQRPIVKGDARSLNIAAASILAKVTRDRAMVALDARYPGYGFAQHKGYPTQAHRDAIAALGPSPIHRRSFRMPAGPATGPDAP